MHIILTDENDVIDAIGKLRTVYHNIMKLSYDNTRTNRTVYITEAADVERKTPLELFSDFYELQNNQPLTDEQREFMKEIVEQVWEGRV